MRSFNLSAWALRQRPLVTYLMLVLLAAGSWSYLGLGRSEDPPFTIRTMVVQARWPGATMDDTLRQVTERLERKLQETPGIDYLRSYTSAGETTIFVNVRGSVPPREIPEIWDEIRKKIGDIRHTLPQGVQGPFFDDEFGDTYAIIYGFTADGFSHRELRDHVEDVRSRLLRIPDVSKIDIVGAQDERIFIEFSTEELAGLDLDRQALIQALHAQNAVTPAGTVTTGDERLMLYVSGAFRSVDDILDVTFTSDGRTIRLRDIAQVSRGYEDPPGPMFRVNGVPAIGLAISMRKGGDALELGEAVGAAMAEIVADLPVGIEPTLVASQPVTVEGAVDEFMKALWEAIAIVILVSLASLGLRAGTVVAISIPLVLAIVFMTMNVLAIDLHRVSLGALIIALGLLVDDAMITVETMMTRLEAGDAKESAATFAYTSTAFPMLTGTLVTVAGFVPIGFARSQAGEYTFSIFAVVAIALVASWFVAVLFAPLLGVWMLKAKPARHAGPGRILRGFRRFLVVAMRMRWLTILLTIGLFAGAVYAARHIPQQFFPTSDRLELLVDLKLPQNASIHASADVANRLDGILRDDVDVERWSTYVGRGAVRFYLPLNVQLPHESLTQAVIVTRSLEGRERARARLEELLDVEFPEAVGRVYPLELGPPVGWPLQYRVSGPDMVEVREAALRLAALLAAHPNVRKVNYDWLEPARTVRIRLDQEQANALGVSSQDIAQALNAVMSGATVTQVRDDIYLVDLAVRAQQEQRVSFETIRSFQVPLPSGRVVPLSQFASFEYGQEFPVVWRRNRVPTLTVQSDVVGEIQPATVVADLDAAVARLEAALPMGYDIAVGGIVEESRISEASVAAVVPVMLFLMLTLLMIQLQSFQRLLLVLSVAPLGVIGVVAALLAADKPLGFVALLGILSLVGMIVRNAVILVDQVETERMRGHHPWDAVVEATTNRFRPILLTAATAILAMSPIAPTVFWGPMAYAIMGGLAVATLLTLVSLPALYVAWFRIREPSKEVDPNAR